VSGRCGSRDPDLT